MAGATASSATTVLADSKEQQQQQHCSSTAAAAAEAAACDARRPLQQDHMLLQARHAVARQARRHYSGYENPKLESNLDSCPWDGSGGPSSHAGCFVVHGTKLLVVELISGEFSVPGGSYRYGEAPAC